MRAAIIAAALLLCLAPAAQAQRDPAVASRTERVTAIVESVDPGARTVLLRREDGSFVSMKLGPEVRNFAQIKAGDRVVVEHTEAVAAAMAKPGQPPVVAAEADTRRPVGARPGAATADVLRVRVTIDQVFSGGQMVSFTGPAGNKRTIAVRNPDMQAFVRGLRTGDQVEVTFVDVVAIRVEPAR
jgi:translation initiation factor IF-1